MKSSMGGTGLRLGKQVGDQKKKGKLSGHETPDNSTTDGGATEGSPTTKLITTLDGAAIDTAHGGAGAASQAMPAEAETKDAELHVQPTTKTDGPEKKVPSGPPSGAKPHDTLSLPQVDKLGVTSRERACGPRTFRARSIRNWTDLNAHHRVM
eukprot:SAG31_NODE_431_length_15775_cov_3.350663_11_plen_153_part_00